MLRPIRRSALAAACSVLALGAAGPASALTIDFEEFVHGGIVADPTRAHPGYALTVDNNPKGDFDVAVAFDTGVTGSLEPDLEFDESWSGGNIQRVDLGNILIIQANDSCGPDVCSEPEDEGFRPRAGTFDFRLDTPAFGDFAFDLVDVDDTTKENGEIAFFNLGPGEEPDSSNLVASFSFMDFEGQDGVVYGDNSANHVLIPQLATYNATVVTMAGSGGIDNLAFTPVPEPGTALLVSLGLGTLALRGRRRRA